MAQVVGRCEVEVRSRKLGYLNNYQAMLSSIAQHGAELLLMRFAPTSGLGIGSRRLRRRRDALPTLCISPGPPRGPVVQCWHCGNPQPAAHTVRRGGRNGTGRGAPAGRTLVRTARATGSARPGHSSCGRTRRCTNLCITRHVPTIDTEPNRFVRLSGVATSVARRMPYGYATHCKQARKTPLSLEGSARSTR